MKIFNQIADNKEDIINGRVILINKPSGYTSFYIVKTVRSFLKKKYNIPTKLKVGHAGTLDPFAKGLLVLCTGRYTKRISEIQNLNKDYVAILKLGEQTESLDTETDVVLTKKIPKLTLDEIKKTTSLMLGKQMQVPPSYSAKKINGERAYNLARKKKDFVIKPVEINIYKLDVLEYKEPYIKFITTCSKGTYIRTLASDIASKLNTIGYLTNLTRETIGEYSIKNSLELDCFLER